MPVDANTSDVCEARALASAMSEVDIEGLKLQYRVA